MKSKQRHPVSLKQYRKLCGKWQSVPVARDVNGNFETQEMLDFCGQHNITSDVEVIPIQKLNDAYGPGTSNLDEIRIVRIGWMEDALV
jgi:D-arabinose 1-dehydrogenase-like Zn-dependent alcohol dehydrogenase